MLQFVTKIVSKFTSDARKIPEVSFSDHIFMLNMTIKVKDILP